MVSQLLMLQCISKRFTPTRYHHTHVLVMTLHVHAHVAVVALGETHGGGTSLHVEL